MGDEVAANGYNVGLTLDLNGSTLEDLVDTLIAKFAADLGLNIDLSFRDIAAGGAAVKTDGTIDFADSKVNGTYDILDGTWGHNINGDAADTLITLLDMVLTTDNINAVLGLVLKDKTLDEVLDGLGEKFAVLKDVAKTAINNPTALVDTVIKVLAASNYTVEDYAVLYDVITTTDYKYSDDTPKEKVELALGKLDAVLNNAIGPVLNILGDIETMPELVKGLADADLDSIEAVVDYFLKEYALTPDIVNMIMGAIIGIFGGMDEKTFTTVNDLLNKILGVKIDLAAFTADSTYFKAFAGSATTWAELAAAHTKYVYTYVDGENDDGTPKLVEVYLANEGETTYDGKDITAKTDDNGVQATKVVVEYSKWFDNAVTTDEMTTRLIDIVLEIITPVSVVLDFLFRGADVEILIDDLKLQGGEGWSNVIVPLFKAFGVTLTDDADATAVDCVRSLLNGVLALVDDLAAAPVNTIIRVISGLSYFIASNGVEEAVYGILAPITGFLGLLSEVISMDQINALLKGLINMDLNDIAGIAGATGDKLVDMINGLIGEIALEDKVSGETYTINLLPDDFFAQIAAHAITVTGTDDVDADDVMYGKQKDNEYVTAFSIDGTDALMYVLSTVCSEDFLKALATKLGKDVSDDEADLVENIIIGLAGKQNSIVDILVALLTDYDVTYAEYTRDEIDKIDVEHNEPMNDENLEDALAALDPIIEAVIGMFVADADSLAGLIDNLLADAGLGEMLMGLLVPVLAGLDIDAIIGYVNDLTNLDISIAPQAFAESAKFGSKLADFIGDAKTWAELRDNTTYFTAGVGEDGKATYTFNKGSYEFGINTIDDLVAFACDLLMPLDQVLELLLVGEELIVLEDETANAEGEYDDIRIVGGRGYNFALLPLLEALSIDALTEAEYEAQAATDGHLKPILDMIIGKVDALLDAPISTLLTMLANLFYFVGSGDINKVANNLVAFANYLLAKVDAVFHIGVKIDLSADTILTTELGTGNSLPAGVYINVDPDDLIAMINDLLAGIVINGKPLGISLGEVPVDENGTPVARNWWLYMAAQMAAFTVANETVTVTTVPTAQVDSKGAAATWTNIAGDAEDTFTALINAILTESNTYAIAELVNGLLGNALTSMDGQVTKTAYTVVGDGTVKYFADSEVTVAEDGTITAKVTTTDAEGKETEENLTLEKVLVEGTEEALTKVFEDASELNVKGLITDILYSPNGLKNLISAVVLLLSGEYNVTIYDIIYKVLGTDTAFDNADDRTALNTAIDKLDAIITREVVELLPKFIPADATGILGTLRGACDGAADLSGMITNLLDELLFTEENYDKLMGILVKAIGGALSADLCGTLKDLLGIDLMPAAFAAATGNAAIQAFVNVDAGEDTVLTWADVWAAHSNEDAYAGYDWNLAGSDDVVTTTEFVDAVLALLKPLNSILDFIFAGGSIKLLPGENSAAVTLPGGNAYNTALVPLFKALGIDLASASSTSEALDKLVNGLLGDRTNGSADGLVEKLGTAPLNTIIELVAGLSYLLANNNLEPIIKNLLAPVFAILDLLEPVVSMNQIDSMLKKVLVINGKAYGLSDILAIGNNGGANLVELLNTLIGGFEIKDEDGNVVDTLTLLPENFFTELSKVAVDVTATDSEDNTVATAWTYDSAEALMYILDTVFSDNFLAVLANMIGKGEETTITTIITGLANKEIEVVDLLLMFFDKYTVYYNKIPQTALTGAAASYAAFASNASKVEATLPGAMAALDALIPTVLGLVGLKDSKGNAVTSLGGLVDDLLAGANLGDLLMGLLVPVLAGLNIDDILGYVNDLTNLDVTLDPQAFAKDGTKLGEFIGDAETWADVLTTRFDVTYKEDGKTVDKATLKTVDVENEDGTTTAVAAFDFELNTLTDVVDFVCDLLMPLDVVFQILLSGKQIIALEDEDINKRADIRINGGYGYNYAIIPLLEALGAKPMSQEAYDEAVAESGSSLKPILEAIVERVNEILAAPIDEVLGLVANLFYFIGSDGINTIVTNLVAPVVNILNEVCDVYPISIKVAIENGEFKFDFDYENKKGLKPGLDFNISAAELSNLISGLLANIEINGEKLGLSLNLDWLKLAAAMAERDVDGNIIYSESAMEYGYGSTEMNDGAGRDPYMNITGNAADTLVTLLTAILTKENVAVIKELVNGLLKDVTLPAELTDLIDRILSDSNGIVNLIGTLILVLTGEHKIDVMSMIFKYLGTEDYNVTNADAAIDTLDRLIGKAVPVVLPLIAGDATEDSLIGKISAAANNVPANTPVLTHIINTLLAEFVFTQNMMNTVTDLVVGTIGGILSADLCGTLKDLLGIDLSPAGFAAAADNDEFTAYVTVADADEDGVISWADVIAAHKHTDTNGTEDTADDVTTIDQMFTLTKGNEQAEFLGNIFDVLQVLEPVLAFILTGKDLVLAQGFGVEDGIKLKGNAGYENAIYYLYKGLGLEEMGANWKELDADDDAIDALSYVIDYVLTLVNTLGEAPFDTILVLVANLSYLIANNGVEVIITNLVSPILSLVNALEGTISRAQLDALIESFVKVDLLGKPLNLTNILKIADNNGKVLVDLINGLLKNIEVKDDKGNTIHYIYALPDTFFADLAKAAINVDAFEDSSKTNVGDAVKTWHVDTGDALMYILKTVLTEDFLEILCKTIGIAATNEDGSENMVYGIINSLAGKDEALLDVLLSLLVKYLVEYEVYNQPELTKDPALTGDKMDQFSSVVSNIDALIPTVLGLVGLKDSAGNAVTSLEGLVNGFINDDIANMLVGLITELLAGLPSETIDMILGYVTELTSLTDLDITPAAFANNDFGSQVKAFFNASASKAGTTLDKLTWAQVWEVNSKEVKAEDGTVSREFTGYTWNIKGLNDLVNLLCDFIQPLDSILALLLMGGQVASKFEASGKTSVGKSLSVLGEINVMGGMGYNYAIIPLLELLGIDAMSQEAYDEMVADNHGSVLYPILTQIVNKVSGDNGVLANPISWLTDILANICYVLGNGDITTIVDNLIAPVNMLVKKVDKLFPIAIDIAITDGAFAVKTFLGQAHPGYEAGIHVRIPGEELSALLENLLNGLKINIGGSDVAIINENGLELDWLKLAAMAGADVDGNKKVDFSSTKMDTKYDIYKDGNTTGKAYKTIKGDAAATFYTIIDIVINSVNLDGILNGLGLDASIKDLIGDLLEDPNGIIDAITNLLGGKAVYQPIQNAPVNITGVDYRGYLTFTEENADIIAENIDGLVADILKAAGLGSLKDLVGSFLKPSLVTDLVNTVIGLLAGDSVAGILETVKGLDFYVRTDLSAELSEDNKLVLDLTVKGFQTALERLDLNGKHKYMQGFYNAIKGKATWAEVGTLSNINWGFEAGDINGLVRAIAGVLTPLNEILGLLLNGEGKYLNVLGIVDIAGGNGYDYGIIPLIEALGFTYDEVYTAKEYRNAIDADETQTLGYILGKVAALVNKLLGSAKPVKTLLTLLPNLAYYFLNDGLLLTVKNLLAPIYNVLNLVLPLLGVDLESFLKIEQLVHNIDLGIVILDNKFNFRIPEIDWRGLVQQGGDKAIEVSTARTHPGTANKRGDQKANGPWANSFNTKMEADEYASYIKNKDLTNANLYKGTQTHIVADAGDTLVFILTWVFDMFGDAHNREALVQWLVDFFEIKGGAVDTVRYAINELFNKAEVYNSSDLIVSALLYALGMTVIIDAGLMGNMAQIQTIFKQLFDALGSNGNATYGDIARVMENLTHVWEETIGPEEDHEDVKEEVEESLNWFQRLIKKIKEFFQRIFSIFK